jgi:hypothetical protein
VTDGSGRFEGLLWVIWDGASCDVVRQLLELGDLPTLRSVSGGVVPLAPLAPSCQTPPSLATLFTGAAITDHGVTGFRVPALGPQKSFVDSRSGFERALLRRPLIWDDLAAGGVDIGLSHAPWIAEQATRTPTSIAIHAFERCLDPPRFIQLEAGASGPTLRRSLRLGDREVVVSAREGAFEVSAPQTGERVSVTPSTAPGLAWRPLRLGPGIATRVAVVVERDGAARLVHSGLWAMRAQPPRLQQSLDEAVGPFVGKTLGDAYHSGGLGQRATEGGHGAAERALLESAQAQVESFTRCAELVLREGPRRGLVISYLPTIDEIQHEVFRWWDAGPAHARDLLRRAYALADQHLARLLARVGSRCVVVVSSDHGAAVLRRNYHVNESLARADLLGFDVEGRIDVASSQAAYHPAANGSVWVNTVDRTGGLVPPGSRRSVVDAVERAIRAVRDPSTGHPPVEVRRVGEAERGSLGDLWLDTAPGYECRWEAAAQGAEFTETPKGGTHVTPTGESTLRGMLAIGDGCARDLGQEMSLADVYSLVRALVRGPG